MEKKRRIKKRRGPMPGIVRPFRIWDENAKRPLPWRSYKTVVSAINHAVIELVWLEVGNTYTIYDDRNSYTHRSFTKKLENNKTRIVEMA